MTYCFLTSFFRLSIRALVAKIKLCDGAWMAIFGDFSASCIFSETCAAHFRPVRNTFVYRSHVLPVSEPTASDSDKSWMLKKRERIVESIAKPPVGSRAESVIGVRGEAL